MNLNIITYAHNVKSFFRYILLTKLSIGRYFTHRTFSQKILIIKSVT